MKVLNLVQGSQEWIDARLGLPTASCYDRILTPAKWKYAAGATTYRNELLAEYLLGYPFELIGGSGGGWTERGTEIEGEARSWYEFERDVQVQQVGLVLRDDERTGGSPDGLVGDDGLIELKTPAIHTMIGYLLDPPSLDASYVGQTQGLLYLTGRDWLDLIAYNPDIDPVVRRIEPDPEYHAALDAALTRFTAELDAAKEVLAPHRNAVAA